MSTWAARVYGEDDPADRDVRLPLQLMRAHRSVALLLLLLGAGCAGIGTAPPSTPQPTQTGKSQPQSAPHPLDPQQAERIRRTMVPLIAAMDHPRPLNQVRVGIVDDPHVNAASRGGGEFYVTTALLQKASDDQLRGVLAHELAHDDLGHVAKAQALGTGLGIGMIILDQIFPGSGRITSRSPTAIAAAKSMRRTTTVWTFSRAPAIPRP